MATGRETEIFLGEWKEEVEGVLIGVVGGARMERLSRIPEGKLPGKFLPWPQKE